MYDVRCKMLQFTGAHIVLEDDRRTDLVDQCLILTGFLFQAYPDGLSFSGPLPA